MTRLTDPARETAVRLLIEVEAGATGTMSFEANATGRFAIVAHGHGASHAPFAYLEVHPE